MEIRYCMTRREAWRFNLAAFRRPTLWVQFLIYAALMTWFAYWQYPSVQASLYLHSPHFWWLSAIFFATVGVFAGLILAVLWKSVCDRYPDAAPGPMSVTVLTPECLQDTQRKLVQGRLTLTPMRVLWTDIVSVHWRDGDVCFLRKSGSNLVPRSAFETPRHAQQFLDLAQLYWRCAQDGSAVPDTEAAWPPAPRSGV